MEQNISNIKRLSNPTAYLFSVIGFFVLVGLVIGAVWGATAAVEYQWRWFKVPKYFMYQESVIIHASGDGEIQTIAPQGKKVGITVDIEGDTTTYTVPKGSFDWVEGDTFFIGDVIAEYEGGWKPGILLKGLWLTLKISFISTLLGILLGIIGG